MNPLSVCLALDLCYCAAFIIWRIVSGMDFLLC